MFGEGFFWSLFSFRGRLSVLNGLVALATSFLLWVIALAINTFAALPLLTDSCTQVELIVAFSPFAGFLVWTLYAISVKRLHDIGYSGWWALIGLIPYVGNVLWLVHVIPGTNGPNAYGRETNSAT